MQKHPRSDSEKPIVESATRARQGVTGHGVRYVLVFALLGAMLAFAILLSG